MFENKPLLYPDTKRTISPGWQWTIGVLAVLAFALKIVRHHNTIDKAAGIIATAVMAVAMVLYHFRKVENLSFVCGILLGVYSVIDMLFIL